MGKIFLLRHGETDYHAQKRLLGRMDIGLNDKGREQAQRVAGYFAGVELAAIYSSPLSRCRQTARPTADSKGLQVQVMDDLIEVEMGEWDGRLVKDLFEQDGELLARWMRNPSSVTLPGGEDFNAVRARTESALAKLTERHAEGPPALVVSHGGPIRMMLCQTLRMDIDDMLRIEIELASISSIAFFPEGIDKSGIVTLTNDTSHLK